MLDGAIAITGSMRLIGVWEVVDGKIAAECDEDWRGRVWVLAPPEDFLALCREIDAWREEHPAQALRSSSTMAAASRTVSLLIHGLLSCPGASGRKRSMGIL